MNTQKIAVVTDSSTLLPDDAKKGLDIHSISSWLHWEGEHLLDGIDIDPPTFYQRLKDAKTLPTTSQATPKEFEDFFRKVGERAKEIVSVLVSSKMSGTVESALAAKANLPDLNIRIVDSLSGSMGTGFMVLAAARAAAIGKSIDKVVAAAEQLRERIHFLFVVDTLKYLHRGGRIGGAKRLLGTALQIKPILQFKSGNIEPFTQERTMKKAIKRILDTAEEQLAGKKIAEAAVVDIDNPSDGDSIAETVRQRFGATTVHRTTVSPVVGTHIGPGAVGLAYYTDV